MGSQLITDIAALWAKYGSVYLGGVRCRPFPAPPATTFSSASY